MCTLTIRRENDSVLVTMNRDEQRDRISERAPFLWDSPTIFSPQDTKANGTWIGVNAEGKTAALLNGYQVSDGDIVHKTRGEIIPKILSGQEIDPKNYASFHLIEITQDQVRHSHWDGKHFEKKVLFDDEWHFFTSSSWQQDQVKKERHQKFQRWIEEGAEFEEYLPTIHMQHNSESTAESILMVREDACTKSITQFEISKDQKTCRYWSNPYEIRSFEQYQGLF